jgi:hypothetical protein
VPSLHLDLGFFFRLKSLLVCVPLSLAQADARARLLPLCQYAKKGAVTHCTFQCATSGTAAYGTGIVAAA